MGKYKLFIKALPIAVLFFLAKVVIYYFDLECIPANLSSMLPTVLTSIIFVLGFLLAGVIGDYKESERIPNDVTSSLYSIWQEAYLHYKVKPSEKLKAFLIDLQSNSKSFFIDFFLNAEIKNLRKLDDWAEQVQNLEGTDTPTAVTLKMKNELLSIRKSLNRIIVIKKTNFLPSVFATVKIIICVFLTIFLLMDITPWWGGALLPSLFAFMVFAIIFVIDDIEDPFEYKDNKLKGRGDEINLEILMETISEIEETKI